jgi:hypothetical protein
MQGNMDAVFPEALKSLKEADSEVYDLVQAEKKRQWCAFFPNLLINSFMCVCSLWTRVCSLWMLAASGR